MTAEIYHFPGTDQEVNDQIDNSECPIGLSEVIKQIARAQKREVAEWWHGCKGRNGKTVALELGKICPHCYYDMAGNYHGKK